MSRGPSHDAALETLDVAADAREGLSATPKRLAPRLFYDAAGSALFEQITALPEYYLTRAELSIFETHADEILTEAGHGRPAGGPEITPAAGELTPAAGGLTVVELGAGSGAKTRVLLQALLARQARATYVPVDVSRAALELCARDLSARFPRLELAPLEGRYRVALPRLRELPGRKLVLFIGSSVGNFDPREAEALLRDLRDGLHPGDALLLGTDLVKSPELLVPAYDDAAGITARFNLNLLARLNRELGADFDLSKFKHHAVWNAAEERMEMHLESTAAQTVHLPAIDLRVELGQGERIHTESCHKFTPQSAERLLRAGGFTLEHTFMDSKRLFADHLARAA